MKLMADMLAISCLVGSMDHLWFHQGVLSPKILQPSSPIMVAPEEELSSNYSSAYSSQTQVISERSLSIISNQQDEQCSSEQEQDCDEKEAPKRSNLSGRETLSLSSSPSTRKRRSDAYPGRRRRRLCKTMSCKSLCELELEEVKGFMDLGFTFDREHLDKRMMSVLPGLQRLDLGDKNISTEVEESIGGGVVRRPYLSEAWMVRRPDSPLLRLRIPRVSTADDMKKHLKYWAKTVATAIDQLES